MTKQKNLIKPLSKLTLLDRFLFSCAMEDKRILELTLRIILKKELELREPAQTEKEFRTMPWLRSIRLDVFALDMEDTLYNTEVQKKNIGNLRKRSRFYQALVDSSLLPPGEIDFNQLPAAYLIMIAPFDLYGEGKYQYTFQMKCLESENLWLEDGVTRIFLNTRGTNDAEVSEELVALLRYFEETSEEAAEQSGSDAIREIHERVQQLKDSEEIGVRYMQEWEERAYERMEAREEGRKEGRAEGKAEGKSEGLQEGRTKGENQFAALTERMIRDGRTEELLRVSTEPEYRRKLYREYGLGEEK